MNRHKALAADPNIIAAMQDHYPDIHISKGLDLSVLVVEDMIVNQKVMKIILEDIGCRVTIAGNGQDACCKFHESTINAFNIFKPISFDVILMDLEMPVMNGIEAVKYLKDNFKKLPPVLALTADETLKKENDFRAKGFDDCIIKPVHPKELSEKIKFWAEKQKMKESRLDFLNGLAHESELKPIINHCIFKNIVRYAQDNQFSFVELYDSFVDDMEGLFYKCKKALQDDDQGALKQMILTVKGLSGNFGASRLGLVAKFIDEQFNEEPDDEAGDLILMLHETFQGFNNQVKKDYSFLF
jgi:CheY-like chemotaxis protein